MSLPTTTVVANSTSCNLLLLRVTVCIIDEIFIDKSQQNLETCHNHDGIIYKKFVDSDFSSDRKAVTSLFFVFKMNPIITFIFSK